MYKHPLLDVGLYKRHDTCIKRKINFGISNERKEQNRYKEEMSRDYTIQNRAVQKRTIRVTVLFILFGIAMTIFLISILNTIMKKRDMPSHNSTIHDRSLRGSIISSDRYTLSYSHKTYTASVRAESIRPEKRALFIRLFSIYSGVVEQEIKALFYTAQKKPKQGYITLSKTIPLNSAMRLKSLAYKLRRLKVFRSIKLNSGVEVLYGLDIVENGERRAFPLEDVLSPILGHTRNSLKGKYSRSEGKQGLERHYENHLNSKIDGNFTGKRDVSGSIIHDKNSIKVQRQDGLDLHLNIPLSLQKRVEGAIDNIKHEIDAEEILVGIMQSRTGKVLSLATTKRYQPSHILQKDIPALNPKFAEYPYEAGSVIKPLALAIALEGGYVSPNTRFNTHNGKLKVPNWPVITDDHKFPFLNAIDIIVHSSNIGISKIVWRVPGKVFREGLLKFGIASPSGIDLSRDLTGTLKKERLLNHKMHRANTSYGYGMTTTFAQLLKAYSAFNNYGLAMTPKIVEYLKDSRGKRYTRETKVPNSQVISKETAQAIQKMLIEVVERGTGQKAQYKGLQIGGKTGTAHIAKNGKYTSEYHSSFYGFANDAKGHRYTLGVLVIKAKGWRKYFASQSAVPTFNALVDVLVDQGYLQPNTQAEQKRVEEPEIYNFKLPIKDEILDENRSEQRLGDTNITQKGTIESLFNMTKEKREVQVPKEPSSTERNQEELPQQGEEAPTLKELFNLNNTSEKPSTNRKQSIQQQPIDVTEDLF